MFTIKRVFVAKEVVRARNRECRQGVFLRQIHGPHQRHRIHVHVQVSSKVPHSVYPESLRQGRAAALSHLRVAVEVQHSHEVSCRSSHLLGDWKERIRKGTKRQQQNSIQTGC